MKTEIQAWWDQGITPIPLVYRTKQPKVKWKMWVEQKPPTELVESWFSTQNIAMNTGVILDKGLTVLDFDSVAAYFRWRLQHTALAETYTVKTARGYHLYYYLEQRLAHSKKFESGDIKATGIVVAPPSTHPTGYVYQVMKAGEIKQIENVDCFGLKHFDANVEFQSERKPSNGNSLVQRIKQQVDIVHYLNEYTDLKWFSKDYMMGLCPFHKDSNLSLVVYPAEDICYCFSPNCPAHRRTDVINCAAFINHSTVSEAVLFLARKLL
jgi:hypothetical protein